MSNWRGEVYNKENKADRSPSQKYAIMTPSRTNRTTSFTPQPTKPSERSYHKQLPNKYDQFEGREAAGRRERSEWGESTLTECKNLNDVSVNAQIKKEGARRKDFEMRVNNIDTINDKINSLLNMVNRKQLPSRTVEDSPSGKYPQYSAKVQKQKNTPQQEDKYAKYTRGEHQRTGERQLDDRSRSGHNKSAARLKTISHHQYQSPYQAEKQPRVSYNQEDSSEPKRDADLYSGGLAYQPSLELSPLARKREKGIIYHRKTPVGKEENKLSKELDRILNRQNTSEKRFYEDDSLGRYERKTHNIKKTDQYNREPSPAEGLQTANRLDRANSSTESAFMPITLVKTPVREKQTKNSSVSSNQYIEDQLRRIKSRISESESNNHKYEERLYGREHKQVEHQAGKINRYTPKKEKPFRIEVHPVANDKPLTILIAQRLQEQTQLDQRVRRHLMRQGVGEGDWNQLEQQLRQRGVRLTQLELKDLLGGQDCDDTFQEQSQSSALGELADLVAEAHKHWEKKVYGCVSGRGLKGEGFEASALDMTRKGYLGVSDLISFVGEYTAQTMCRADMGMVYWRMKWQDGSDREGISYGTFTRTVAI